MTPDEALKFLRTELIGMERWPFPAVRERVKAMTVALLIVEDAIEDLRASRLHEAQVREYRE